MRRTTTTARSVATGALALGVMTSLTAPAFAAGGEDRLRICHAHTADGALTGYNTETVSTASLVGSGHADEHDADIIPPFEYVKGRTPVVFAGKNWDAEGQAIHANGCLVPGPGNTDGGDTDGGDTDGGGDGGTGEAPVDQPTEPVDQPTEPVDQPTEPVDQPTEPVDQPTEPVDQPTEPVDQPTEPVDQPTEPVDGENPTEVPGTDPVEQPTEPTDPADGENPTEVPAQAPTTTTKPRTSTSPVVRVVASQVPVVARTTTTVRTASSLTRLPRTGGGVGGALVAGFVLVAGGAGALLTAGRKPRQHA